jgi:hypothetical protein
MIASPSSAYSMPLMAVPSPSSMPWSVSSEMDPTMPNGDQPETWRREAALADGFRREMRELITETRTDLRERINEVKTSLNDRLGPMERDIGALKAGKADAVEVQKGLKDKAEKRVETIVYGLIGIFLVTVATVVAGFFIRAPSYPPHVPSAVSGQK